MKSPNPFVSHGLKKELNVRFFQKVTGNAKTQNVDKNVTTVKYYTRIMDTTATSVSSSASSSASQDVVWWKFEWLHCSMYALPRRSDISEIHTGVKNKAWAHCASVYLQKLKARFWHLNFRAVFMCTFSCFDSKVCKEKGLISSLTLTKKENYSLWRHCFKIGLKRGAPFFISWMKLKWNCCFFRFFA